ncbi:hypothetical protein HaLaN_12880, partial [Haematococcus lacustris]
MKHIARPSRQSPLSVDVRHRNRNHVAETRRRLPEINTPSHASPWRPLQACWPVPPAGSLSLAGDGEPGILGAFQRTTVDLCKSHYWHKECGLASPDLLVEGRNNHRDSYHLASGRVSFQ